MRLNADNLETKITDEKLVVEPQYVEYLRSQDYRIDGIEGLHAVPSDSSKDTAHIVAQIQTYNKPTTHGDYLDHGLTLWVCDCWSYRETSADVSKSFVQPSQSGECKHIQQVDKVARAQNDDQQETLL